MFGNPILSTDIVGEIFPISYTTKNATSIKMGNLNNRYMSLMLGLQENWITKYGIIEVAGENDVTGTSNGFMGTLQYGAPVFLGSVKETFMIEPELGIEYDNQTLNNYYFGVSQPESITSGLPQYSASDSLGPYEAFNFVYSANQRLSIYLEFQANQLPNQVFDSPMVEKAKTIFSSQFIATYTF